MSDKLRVNDGGTAYIKLPSFPKESTYGVVARTVTIEELVPDYKSPRIHLDFNDESTLIGIEILA